MHKFIWATAMILAIAQPAAAKMYKWVDESGVTQYGDTIPPQYLEQSKEIDKRGKVIKKELTPEERKAKEEEEARRKETKQQQAEQQRLDSALRNTYTDEKDIDLKRDRDLQQVEAALSSAQSRLQAVETKLADFRKQADTYTRAKKPLPPGLNDDIAKTEAEKQQVAEQLAQHQSEKDAVRAKYEGYKQRFIELRKARYPNAK